MSDPVGNRLEVFHGAETTSDPFQPGRSISGFRTGPLGMGHAVLTAERFDEVLPFYRDMLGFQPSDYILQPFAAYFFHVNPRHHSLAFIETGKNGIHHLMVETCLSRRRRPGLRPRAAEAGDDRHHLRPPRQRLGDSFYSWSPSKFLVEYGWGGRTIDPANWTPHERTEGPSLWGHDRSWLDAGRTRRRRATCASRSPKRATHPAQVMEGNYKLAPDVCPWWDATVGVRKIG